MEIVALAPASDLAVSAGMLVVLAAVTFVSRHRATRDEAARTAARLGDPSLARPLRPVVARSWRHELGLADDPDAR